MNWVWNGFLGIVFIALVTHNTHNTHINAASLGKRSTDSGKKIVRYGDQLFIVNKDDDDNDEDDHDDRKRSLDPPPPGDKIVRAGDELFLVKKDDDDNGDEEPISKRSAVRDETYRWEDKTVPYIFDHTYRAKDRAIVISAMDEWEKHTCLKFRPASNSDKHKVKFVNGDGCFSFVGMVEATQDISLDKDGCRYVSTALHEIGHALGMYHTQVRADRDKYIKINLSDVKKNLQDNFIKQSWKNSYHYGVDYDFLSIMHYDGSSFTSHGGTSIKTLDPKWQKIIGNVKHLSFGDIEMMNKMYHCAPKSCGKKDSDCPGTSFVDKSCTCVCPGPSPAHPVINCADRGKIKSGGKNGSVSRPVTQAPIPAAAASTTESWEDGSEWENDWDDSADLY